MHFENPYKLDLTNDPIEELYLWENLLAMESEAKHRVTLDLISLAIVARQANGDTLSCYSDDTEHVLHPEATDVRSLIPQQERDRTWEDFGGAAI